MATFKSLEQSGWTQKASAYDEHFATITDQAIAPILDSVGDIAGLDVLDICCEIRDSRSLGRGHRHSARLVWHR